MPSQARSLLDLKSLTTSQIQFLLTRATALSRESEPAQYHGQTAALLFFEPSTRTRMSFETAAHRMGLGPILLDGVAGTSLEKGETLEDTILNVAAMKPRVLVIRAGDSLAMDEIARQVSIPVINAGWGKRGHPTQALLDVLTLQQEYQDLARLKVLFVGDIRHSRVVASHFELLEKMGAEIGLSGPESFLVDRAGTSLFRRLDEGLEWCDAVVALRVQLERHGQAPLFSAAEYRADYGIHRSRLAKLRSKGILMHPGPVNWGTELDRDVLADSRVRILKQVTNGVDLREALLRSLLEERL